MNVQATFVGRDLGKILAVRGNLVACFLRVLEKIAHGNLLGLRVNIGGACNETSRDRAGQQEMN